MADDRDDDRSPAAVTAELATTRAALQEVEHERDRLAAQSRQLAGLIVAPHDLAHRSELLERDLADAQTKIARLRYQRDRARYQLAAQRSRRWSRIGAALAAARRDPGRLLTLPVSLARIVFGPHVAPELRTPREPATPVEPATGATAIRPATTTTTTTGFTSAAGDTARRPVTRLEARYLLPPQPRSVTQLRIGAVVDTFTEASFAPDCDLVTFRPDTWRAALELDPPHLLFVESAWKGGHGSWEFQVGSYTYPESVGLPHLTALIDWCRAHDIPTVFWNKEDPVHFDKFAEAARLFDVVLTTDEDRIPAYRDLPGLRAQRIAALPFAAQPRLHHPTRALPDRDPRPVFGGTYYRNRHPERREQMEQLLDAARPHDLVIYDRTHGQDNDSVGFPDRFRDHIQGGVPYEQMVRIYRDHRLFLNTNSVIHSPTMFSRRIFELLACGTPVVSTPSVGVEAFFGDIVPIVATEAAAATAIEELLTDDDAWHRRSTAGIRAALGRHTYQHRLARIAELVGHADLTPYAERQATVLLLDDGTDRLPALCAELAGAQRGGAAPGGAEPPAADPTGAPVRIAVGTGDPDRFGRLPVTAMRQDDTDPSRERWRDLAGRVHTPMVVVTDPAASAATVTDLLDLLPMNTAGAVGFRADGPAWRYVDEVQTAPLAVDRDLVVEHGWDTDPAATSSGMQVLAAAGVRPFSLGDPSQVAPTGRDTVRSD